jgi:hypothetical protein
MSGFEAFRQAELTPYSPDNPSALLEGAESLSNKKNQSMDHSCHTDIGIQGARRSDLR